VYTRSSGRRAAAAAAVRQRGPRAWRRRWATEALRWGRKGIPPPPAWVVVGCLPGRRAHGWRGVDGTWRCGALELRCRALRALDGGPCRTALERFVGGARPVAACCEQDACALVGCRL